jgi:NADPH:quinone reductase-like Zn-dependent oxidoreductase
VPTAALTALRVLRLGGAGVGKRVLVTGASGGVGRFAVQLAALGGAPVTALSGSTNGHEVLAALGADRVVTNLSATDTRFDVIVESVGGTVLGQCLTRLDPGGALVTFGNSSDEPTTFDVRDVNNGALVRILGFELFLDPVPFGRDLAALLDLVRSDQLNPHLVDVLSWDDMPRALERLRGRGLGGKLALTTGGGTRRG